MMPPIAPYDALVTAGTLTLIAIMLTFGTGIGLAFWPFTLFGTVLMWFILGVYTIAYYGGFWGIFGTVMAVAWVVVLCGYYKKIKKEARERNSSYSEHQY